MIRHIDPDYPHSDPNADYTFTAPDDEKMTAPDVVAENEGILIWIY